MIGVKVILLYLKTMINIYNTLIYNRIHKLLITFINESIILKPD